MLALCKMKPTAFLVNTGRGGIAVEEDIVRAIDGHIIAGAGIDVFVKEPLAADHPFMNCRYPYVRHTGFHLKGRNMMSCLLTQLLRKQPCR